MEKINIAELLKDCPKSMELDCIITNNTVTLEGVVGNGSAYPIRVIGKDGFHHMLTCSGGIYDHEDAKCVIFPKGKTTWEGFQRPFVDGNILSYQFAGFKNRSIYIYRHHHTMNTSYYVALSGDLHFMIGHGDGCALNGNNDTARLATEEEKEKLFQAIKENGYKWNSETKTLEELIEPKFKVGDKVRHKNNHNVVFTITNIEEDTYVCGAYKAFWFDDQDEYELVPNKFDINTLKPFAKVLVRNHEKNEWQPNFFNKYCKEINSFKLIGVCTPAYANREHFVNYCIPYEGNEHLSGKTDDCDEFYKTWK